MNFDKVREFPGVRSLHAKTQNEFFRVRSTPFRQRIESIETKAMVDVPPATNIPPLRTAIVTGATGFIGFNLAQTLSRQNWNVAAVVRPGSDSGRVKAITGLPNTRIYTHSGPTGELVEIVRKIKPDLIFHVASHVLTQHRADDVEPLVASNVLFSTQLVEAMAECGVERLINTSTVLEHYQNRDYDPVCLYAATKRAFEAILEYYIQTARLQVVTLKLCNAYGPGDPRGRLFDILRLASTGGTAVRMSPGEQLIDLVYIDDISRAFLVAAERLQSRNIAGNESFTISSGEPLALRKVAAIYERTTRRTLAIEWGGRPYRTREVMVPWNRGLSLPGWQPRISLEEGIARMLATSLGGDTTKGDLP